ncbi:protein-tyrosine-phosphatase [Coemansia nantahalensis]|nr:protein-tyrosine-phosphatase [Coemansia nantahalensis]
MADIIDPLIPPYRFERVQSRVYRGGYPKRRNFRFLRRLQLKTIVSLIPGDQDSAFAEFCAREGIERVCMEVESPCENVTLQQPVVSRCLELMADPRRLPLYIHCLDGSNVTGVVVMCLRKLQLWRVASLQNEYLRFEQDGEIIPEESEFVEMYTGAGLVLPNPYADWLWPGRSSAGGLPFQDGVHPVMPLARLQLPPVEEPVAPGLLLAPKRSATVPCLHSSDACAADEVPASAASLPQHALERSEGHDVAEPESVEHRVLAHEAGAGAPGDVLRVSLSARDLTTAAVQPEAPSLPDASAGDAAGSHTGSQRSRGHHDDRQAGDEQAGRADGPGAGEIREIALSATVQALAIEGLGM